MVVHSPSLKDPGKDIPFESVSGDIITVVIDIKGYKTRRKQKLVALASSAASRAIRQRGEVRLAPMNAYERRIIHLTLVDNEEVMTHSKGEDPQRRVVVTYVRSQ